MSRIVRVTGVGLLAVLALGACGSDVSGVSGPQKAVVVKADAICSDAQDTVGKVLGDNPAADRDAIHAASDKLMALVVPSENENDWTLLVQSVNNLWISLDDVAQALDPLVNDHARAQAAVSRITTVDGLIKKYGKSYGAVDCANGFGKSIAIPK